VLPKTTNNPQHIEHKSIVCLEEHQNKQLQQQNIGPLMNAAVSRQAPAGPETPTDGRGRAMPLASDYLPQSVDKNVTQYTHISNPQNCYQNINFFLVHHDTIGGIKNLSNISMNVKHSFKCAC